MNTWLVWMLVQTKPGSTEYTDIFGSSTLSWSARCLLFKKFWLNEHVYIIECKFSTVQIPRFLLKIFFHIFSWLTPKKFRRGRLFKLESDEKPSTGIMLMRSFTDGIQLYPVKSKYYCTHANILVHMKHAERG
jgi:hypothetical protein